LSWNEARIGFDALQSAQDGKFSLEGQTTQLAQKIGYSLGIDNYKAEHPFRYLLDPPDARFPVH